MYTTCYILQWRYKKSFRAVAWLVKTFPYSFECQVCQYHDWLFHFWDTRRSGCHQTSYGLHNMPSLNSFYFEWILSCDALESTLENDFQQTLQSYGFSPVWTLSCIILLKLLQNSMSQNLHMYGFSSVCLRSCTVLLFRCENLSLQNRHWYGFTLVCVLSWQFLWLEVEWPLSQYLHLCGFLCSSLLFMWVSSWTFRVSFLANAVLQCRQINGFSRVWVRSCSQLGHVSTYVHVHVRVYETCSGNSSDNTCIGTCQTCTSYALVSVLRHHCRLLAEHSWLMWMLMAHWYCDGAQQSGTQLKWGNSAEYQL